MRSFLILITFSAFFFISCDDDIQIFDDVYIISTQAEADSIKGIIGNAIFDLDNPDEGFRGDIEIVNPSGTQNDPIVDLSLFENYKFWLGSIRIESNDISNLDFLSNLEQIRNGLEITNCTNLTNVNLLKIALIDKHCVINNNPKLATINIGSDIDVDDYEEILLDSVIITNNPNLTTWAKGQQPITFVASTTVTQNPNLTTLEAFSESTLPSRSLDLELNGTTVNLDGMSPATDSLTMPKATNIVATLPGNDYTWLSPATNRFRLRITEFTQFNGESFMDTVLIDSIQFFNITGEIEIEEVCELQEAMRLTPLKINSNSVGNITAEILTDQCPE